MHKVVFSFVILVINDFFLLKFQLIGLVDMDLSLIEQLGLKLVYAMNTHVHADHVTGTGRIYKTPVTCNRILLHRKIDKIRNTFLANR